MGLLRAWMLILLLCLLLPAGCTPSRPTATGQPPLIRVKILSNLDSLLVTASSPPTVRAQSDATGRLMNFPAGQPVQIVLSANGMWLIGNVPSGSGELFLQPAPGTA